VIEKRVLPHRAINHNNGRWRYILEEERGAKRGGEENTIRSTALWRIHTPQDEKKRENGESRWRVKNSNQTLSPRKWEEKRGYLHHRGKGPFLYPRGGEGAYWQLFGSALLSACGKKEKKGILCWPVRNAERRGGLTATLLARHSGTKEKGRGNVSSAKALHLVCRRETHR